MSGEGLGSHHTWWPIGSDACIATAREWIRIGKALSDLPAVTAGTPATIASDP